MKVHIQKIGRKEINTKFGLKWNMSILDEKGQWYSGWPSAVTQSWHEGQTVDIDVTEKVVGQPDGSSRTYKNFTPAGGAQPTSGGPSSPPQGDLMAILKDIQADVRTILARMKSKPVEEEIPPPPEPPEGELL